MNIARKILELAPHVPGAVQAISYVPFRLRKGRQFTHFRNRITKHRERSAEEAKKEIYERVRQLVTHAVNKVPFYREFYSQAGFSVKELNNFNDLETIPIVTKADLRSYSLEERCAIGSSYRKSNTGGTSGQPLEFGVESELVDKEWAYMYSIWEGMGWKPGFLKLRFGGANLGERAYLYVPTENEFLINTYLPQSESCEAIAKLLKRYRIAYLHGYPSAVATFAKHAAENFHNEIVNPLRRSLRGVFLGSEYPAPPYREAIENIFGVHCKSWYGHSEKVILAGEKNISYVYYPFQGYGWTEAVATEGGTWRLIGTNLDGFACPFIRYDTGDLVEPVESESGLLQSFRIREGRQGETIQDASGEEISLTALIFGRHHGVFSQLNHLQIAQRRAGEALLIATGFPDSEDREQRFWQDFDATGIDMKFEVLFVTEPIKTPGGKVVLLVPYPNF